MAGLQHAHRATIGSSGEVRTAVRSPSPGRMLEERRLSAGQPAAQSEAGARHGEFRGCDRTRTFRSRRGRARRARNVACTHARPSKKKLPGQNRGNAANVRTAAPNTRRLNAGCMATRRSSTMGFMPVAMMSLWRLSTGAGASCGSWRACVGTPSPTASNAATRWSPQSSVFSSAPMSAPGSMRNCAGRSSNRPKPRMLRSLHSTRTRRAGAAAVELADAYLPRFFLRASNSACCT